MRLDLGIYAGLMVVGLGAAYWASIPVSEGDADKVTLVSFDPKTITEMTFHSKDTDVAAIRRADERFWVDFKKVEEPYVPPPAPAKGSGSGSASGSAALAGSGSASGSASSPGSGSVASGSGSSVASGSNPPSPPPTPPKEPIVTKERFLANEKLDQLAKGFSPLSALRVVGPANDPKQLEEFGLADKSEYFMLKTADGKTYKMLLGKRSYGTKNRFAMEDGGNRVLLLDDEGFDNLEKANLRAYDRRLVDLELVDVSAAAIKSGAQAKRMGHKQRDKGGELLWTDDEEKAPQKQSYDAWMDRVAKLRLSGYASDEEAKQADAAPPILEIAFERDGKVLDTLSFRKVMQGDKAAYFVTSGFLKTQGKLVASRFEPIEKDMAAILGGSSPAPAHP